jgi:hypothetical protein
VEISLYCASFGGVHILRFGVALRWGRDRMPVWFKGYVKSENFIPGKKTKQLILFTTPFTSLPHQTGILSKPPAVHFMSDVNPIFSLIPNYSKKKVPG